jgi:hypothetical protein
MQIKGVAISDKEVKMMRVFWEEGIMPIQSNL